MNGNFTIFTNWPQTETQHCCKSQGCCFHAQGPAENRPKKDFTVTHLSCLQRLVSALVTTGTTSQPLVCCPVSCLAFFVRASRHWDFSSGVIITSKTKQQQNPNDTAKQNRKEWSLRTYPNPNTSWLSDLTILPIYQSLLVNYATHHTSQDYAKLSFFF